MHTTTLRKVGGSVMMAVPPAVLDMLELKPGSEVAVEVNGDQLVIRPRTRRRYTLDELLAQCNPKARLSREDKEWVDLPPVGNEL